MNPTFQVFLIDAADPLSGMELIWECEGLAHCIVEHHLGDLYLFTDASKGREPVDSHYLLRSPLKVDSTSRTWEVGFVHRDLFSLLALLL